jgi:hypothetical protein
LPERWHKGRILEDAVKRLGLIGDIDRAEMSELRFHPFWAKVEQLGVVVLIHSQRTAEPANVSSGMKCSIK